MQLQTEDRQITRIGGTEHKSQQFGLDESSIAHIFGILRSSLYTNKPLAVVREYLANAWDAHREAGIPNAPVKIIFPTELEPTFMVRDWGKGLSEDDMFRVFAMYGASTKRDGNLSVGGFGIGGKAGFSYNDSFSVSSWHNGKHMVFHAMLDESEIGTLTKVYEADCPIDQTGIEVKVPVNPGDILKFKQAGLNILPYVTPAPRTNIKTSTIEFDWFESGVGGLSPISYSNGTWMACMGCIPYRLNMNQILPQLTEKSLDYLLKFNGIVYMDIGAASVVASREEIEYTERSVDAIVAALQKIVDMFEAHLVKIDAGSATTWEKSIAKLAYLKYLPNADKRKSKLFPKLTLDFDYHWKFVGEDPEKKEKRWKPKLRAHRHVRADFNSIPLSFDARIVVVDSHRHPLRDYQLKEVDRVVSPPPKTVKLVDDFLSDIEAFLVNHGLEGLPVVRLSQISLHPRIKDMDGQDIGPRENKPVPVAIRARGVVEYDWDSEHNVSDPRAWVPYKGVVPSDATGVVLNRFQVTWEFRKEVNRIKEIFTYLNRPLPRLFGFKSTPTRPVHKVPVIPWVEWVESRRKEIAACFPLAEYANVLLCSEVPGIQLNIPKELGPDSFLREYLLHAQWVSLIQHWGRKDQFLSSDLIHWTHPMEFGERTKHPDSSDVWRSKLYQKYPLLARFHSELWGKLLRTNSHEFRYIQAIDFYNEHHKDVESEVSPNE